LEEDDRTLVAFAICVFRNFEGAQMPRDPTIAQLNTALTRQATLLAATDLFWISGWLFLALIASVWLGSKPSGGAVVAAH
jgi:hypothetical protein